MQVPAKLPDDSPTIYFAPGIEALMRASVGRMEPEHYAVLAGSLDDPHRITDFFPMPPMLDSRGQYRASSGAVTLNAPFIEYLLNTSILPFDKYILGVIHSHPGDMTWPSDGAPGSGQGDIPSMRAHLEAAERMGVPWKVYIAPIVTRPGKSPKVTGWIIRLDEPRPIPAAIVWEKEKILPVSGDVTSPDTVHSEITGRLYGWRRLIDEAIGDQSRPLVDRRAEANFLRELRAIDMEHSQALFRASLEDRALGRAGDNSQ